MPRFVILGMRFAYGAALLIAVAILSACGAEEVAPAQLQRPLQALRPVANRKACKTYLLANLKHISNCEEVEEIDPVILLVTRQ